MLRISSICNVLINQPLRGIGCFATTAAVAKPLVKWTIGDVVRKVRSERGLTQAALAKMAGIDKTALGRLERSSDKSERRTIDGALRALKMTHGEVYEYLDQLEWVDLLLRLGRDRRDRVLALIHEQLGESPDREQGQGARHERAVKAVDTHAQARKSQGR